MSVISEVTRELYAFTKDECVRTVSPIKRKPSEILIPNDKKQNSRLLEEEKDKEEELFVAVPHAFCHLAPSHSYDGVMASIPYGVSVQCLKVRGDWALVRAGSVKGWTLKVFLRDKAEVIPEFVEGKVYPADSLTAVRVRQFIKDEFYGGGAGVPCSPAEYVWYRLTGENRTFSWLPLRPRTVGRWAHLLATSDNVLVSEVPITGAIMEYTKSGTGYLWYVDAVDKEETLTVSGIDGSNNRFMHRNLKKVDWKSYTPRFICPL